MVRSSLQTLALLCAAIVSPAYAAEPRLCVPAGGEVFQGELTASEMEPAWKLRFVAKDGPREIPLADLATWGHFVEPTQGIRVVLAGGGVIVAESVTSDDDNLHVESRLFGKLNVPLASVAGIVLRPPLDRARADALDARLLAPGGQTDRLLLENGDELAGSIATIGAAVQLKTDAGELSIGVDKLAAVIFNPALLDKPQLACLRVLAGFRDGSRVTALSLAANHSTAQLKLPGGVELSAPTDSIVALQPLGGAAVYLSDLEPTGYRHIPFLTLSWPYHADRSVLGARLRAGGRPYPKGLGMHSPSRITYDLEGGYRRFDAEVTIDDEAGPRGSVVFRVFTDDGSGQWRERATSDVVRGGQPPVPLSVDLSGAKRLSLLVDYSDRGDEQDHADWLNARLVR
jgi:hypothetical protein